MDGRETKTFHFNIIIKSITTNILVSFPTPIDHLSFLHTYIHTYLLLLDLLKTKTRKKYLGPIDCVLSVCVSVYVRMS